MDITIFKTIFKTISKKPYFKPAAIVVVTFLIVIIMIVTKQSPELEPTSETQWPVDSQRVIVGDSPSNIVLYGEVQSLYEATLIAAVEADVVTNWVKEGDDVKNGQKLVSLDERDAQLAWQQRKAEVAELQAGIDSEATRYQSDKQALESERALVVLQQKQVERLSKLAEGKLGSDVDVDNAKQQLYNLQLHITAREQQLQDHQNRQQQLTARLDKATAVAEQAKLDYERTTITAPFEGRIGKLFVSPGQRVHDGDQVLSMYNVNKMEVRVQVPTKSMQRIRQAVKGTTNFVFKAQAHVDGGLVELTFDRLAGQVSVGQGGVDAIFVVNSGREFLELGRTIEIRLALPKVADSLVIPPSAIYSGHRIYQIKDGRLQVIPVQQVATYTDEANNFNLVVRTKALKTGDEVMTTQLPNAIDGLKVLVVNSKGAFAQTSALNNRSDDGTTNRPTP